MARKASVGDWLPIGTVGTVAVAAVAWDQFGSLTAGVQAMAMDTSAITGLVAQYWGAGVFALAALVAVFVVMTGKGQAAAVVDSTSDIDYTSPGWVDAKVVE